MARYRDRPTDPLMLSEEERSYLIGQVRKHRVARSFSERCRIILRCADRQTCKAVAAELEVHKHTVGKWLRCFLQDRIEGLFDEARPGRPRTIQDDQIAAVIERIPRSTPRDAPHRSIRSMAAATGFSHTTTRRCNLIAPRRSSYLMIRCAWTRCAILVGSICHRPLGRWC